MNLGAEIYRTNTQPMLSLINGGTGVDCTICELAETITWVTGFGGRLVFDATKPDGTPKRLMDVSRLASLGWTARISLKDGLRDAYAWFVTISTAIGNERCFPGRGYFSHRGRCDATRLDRPYRGRGGWKNPARPAEQQASHGIQVCPGGQVRKGETLDAAFRRLMQVEYGKEIDRSDCWLLGGYEHTYEDSVFSPAPGAPGTNYVVLGYVVSLADDVETDLPLEQHSSYG